MPTRERYSCLPVPTLGGPDVRHFYGSVSRLPLISTELRTELGVLAVVVIVGPLSNRLRAGQPPGKALQSLVASLKVPYRKSIAVPAES
jgi:hypothetical protein